MEPVSLKQTLILKIRMESGFDDSIPIGGPREQAVPDVATAG